MRSKLIVVVMALSALSQAGYTTSPTVNAYNRASAKLGDQSFILTTQLRFVRLSDDAGNITIASRYQADITSSKAALGNSNKASSLLEIANSSLSTINDLLNAARTLVVNAQTGQYNDRELTEIDVTLADQLSEIDRIASTTTFNGITLLDGSLSSSFTVSTGDSGTITLTISAANTTRLFPGGALSVATPVLAATSLTAIDDAKAWLLETIADVGAYAQRFYDAAQVNTTTIGGLNNARNGLLNADVNAVTNQQKIDLIRQNAAAALIAQGSRFSSDLLRLV